MVHLAHLLITAAALHALAECMHLQAYIVEDRNAMLFAYGSDWQHGAGAIHQ